MLGRDEIRAGSTEQSNRHNVIQLGVINENEFRFILDTVDLVSDKVPQVSVSMVSYSIIPEAWRNMIRERGLEQSFNILGYVEDEAELSRIVQEHRVGLAIYEPESFKKYGDPARVKTYLANGVPVIVTRVPAIWEDVVNEAAGIAVDYSQEAVAAAIIMLLTDDHCYQELSNGAIKLAERYESEAIFRGALHRMNIAYE